VSADLLSRLAAKLEAADERPWLADDCSMHLTLGELREIVAALSPPNTAVHVDMAYRHEDGRVVVVKEIYAAPIVLYRNTKTQRFGSMGAPEFKRSFLPCEMPTATQTENQK
jgi:hypothetical protein